MTEEHSNSLRFRRKHAWIVGFLVVLCVTSYGVTGWVVRFSAAETLKSAGDDLKKGDTSSARERLRWLLWFEPENADALLIVGISHHVERNFPDAIQVLERIGVDRQQFKGASLVLARSYLLEKRLDRTEDVLDECLRRFPGFDAAREELTQLYMAQFRRREAISLLYDRWDHFPDDLFVLKSLLMVMVEEFSPQSPAIYFEKVNSLHPGQGAVVLALARTAALLGEEKRAERFFEQALELRPDHRLTQLLAAEFFLSRGQDEQAEHLVDSMSNMAFDDGNARSDDRYWAVVSKVRENDGDFEGALTAIQNALEIRPNEYSLLSLKCGLLRKMGRGEEARKLAARASQISDARRGLFLLSNEANLEMLTREQCAKFASLLETLGYPDQASGWRVVMELVD